MTPVTEVFVFGTSDGFREDPGLIKPAFELVLKEEGALSPLYYGVQIENPSTGYVFFNWESYEAHTAIVNSPSYKDIGAALKPCLDGKLQVYHVQFSDPLVALEQPVTEVLILTLNTPDNRTAVVEILTMISEASEKMLVFGQTRETENMYILVGGWPTVEAHWEAVAKPEVAATLDKLYSLANKDHLYHATLSRYP